ncbi:uncharacterized protein TNCV_3928541 [Trichonephila clavipes]|nr:uncharacterized protein TNCV_3928541 [Trichonephila clavipes]
MSRAAHVIGAAIPNVLQPGAFVWFEKTQVLLVKEVPVPGWWPMKQLAVRVHFLRCGSLLDDWSVEGVLSLVFKNSNGIQLSSVRITTGIRNTCPNDIVLYEADLHPPSLRASLANSNNLIANAMEQHHFVKTTWISSWTPRLI